MSNQVQAVSHETTWDIEYYHLKHEKWLMWIASIKTPEILARELLYIINEEKKNPTNSFFKNKFRVQKNDINISSTTIL